MMKFILAVLISIISGLFVKWLTPFNPFGVIWKGLKWFLSLIRPVHPVVDKQTNTEPQWKNYRKDHFFDIDWTWEYYNNEINSDSIIPHCPRCQRKLEVQSGHSFNPYAIVSCYHCEFKKGFDIHLSTLIDRVEQEIEHKIRTGEYKKPDISNQA